MSEKQPLGKLVGALTFSVSISLLLAALGRVPTLALPSPVDRSAVSEWWTSTPRGDIVMSLLRGAALGFSLYVAAVLVVCLIALSANRIAAAQLTLRLLPRWFRLGLASTLGTTLVFGTIASTTPKLPEQSPIQPVSSTTSRVVASDTTDVSTSTTTSTSPKPNTHDPDDDTSDSELTDHRETSRYVIQPGDHLWSIAQAELARRYPDRLVTEREITAYWKRLCKANRHNLRDPDNLDLIFPGDTLVIPD